MDEWRPLERPKTPVSRGGFQRILDALLTRHEKILYGPSLWIHLLRIAADADDPTYFVQQSDRLLLEGHDVNALSHRYGLSVLHVALIEMVFGRDTACVRCIVDVLIRSGADPLRCGILGDQPDSLRLLSIEDIAAMTRGDRRSILQRLGWPPRWEGNASTAAIHLIGVLRDCARGDVTALLIHARDEAINSDPMLCQHLIAALCARTKANPFQPLAAVAADAQWIYEHPLPPERWRGLESRWQERYFPVGCRFFHPSMTDGPIGLPWEYAPVLLPDGGRWMFHRSTVPSIIRTGALPLPLCGLPEGTRARLLTVTRAFPWCNREWQGDEQDLDQPTPTPSAVAAETALDALLVEMVSDVLIAVHPYTVARDFWSSPRFVFDYAILRLQDRMTRFPEFRAARSRSDFIRICFLRIRDANALDRIHLVIENVMLDRAFVDRFRGQPAVMESTISGLYFDFPLAYTVLMERIHQAHQDALAPDRDREMIIWRNLQALYHLGSQK